jgi:hypothetical protein
MEKQIIDYLQSIGFQIQPVSLPLNNFERSKRNLFISIKSDWIRFKLLKFWPIKFKKERPDKSIWFKMPDYSGKTIIEISVSPFCLKHRVDIFESFYTDFDFSKYQFSIHCDPILLESLAEDSNILLESNCDYLSLIESKLLNIIPLKETIRDLKLIQLLN